MSALRIVRDGEVKLSIPGPSADIKSDGTIWVSGMPILGIDDPKIKTKAASAVKEKRYNDIPADAWVRLGDNPNGVWAGWDAEWEKHPENAPPKEAEKEYGRGYCYNCDSYCYGDCGDFHATNIREI